MGFAILLLTLLQTPEIVAARVVEPRESPVSLVGLPCGGAVEKKLAKEPTKKVASTGALQSDLFQCDLNCRVGIRVKKGAVDSIIVTSAASYEQGRVIIAPGPWIKLASQRSCGGETVVDVPVTKPAWQLTGAYFWVSAVKFQDGTTWQVDSELFTADALAKAFVAPKKGK